MSACRDWLKSLWSASFRGVPFYFLNDAEEGGRDVIVHVFPNRDQPFNEDLGEAPRYYSGAAYVHGDDVDRQCAGMIAALTARGAAILTVPLVGPVQVRAMTFKRDSERDQLGYAAFEVKFVREGAATAIVSVPQLARLAFLAADRVVSILVGGFNAAIATIGQPGFVAAAAIDQAQAVAGTIDAIRTSSPVDPDVSATVRDTVAALVAAAPAMFARQAPTDADFATLNAGAPGIAGAPGAAASPYAAGVAYAIRTLAEGMAPDAAQHAMIDLAAAFAPAVPAFGSAASVAPAPAYLTPPAIVSAANAAAIARLARLSALTAWAEALIGRTYVSRPDGVTARAEAAERFDLELVAASGIADDTDLFLAIENLRAAVVDYLSRLITDLKPVVTVSAAIRLPSLWWANRLYADPLRAGELVARNGVKHPSFMPTEFQAVAP